MEMIRKKAILKNISVLFVRMGLLRTSVATTMVIFTTIIFLGGGVLGTLHHLYWSGPSTQR
jgi:nitric oxide reductase subunit B